MSEVHLSEKQIERFYAKFTKGESTKCWHWQGAKNRRGNGIVSLAGKQVPAHKIAWQLIPNDHGKKRPKIPTDKHLSKVCGSADCVNPSHHEIGRPDPAKTARKVVKSKDRPAKPYPEFPLTSHACGQWCKRIKGRLFYFGSWKTGTYQDALKRYESEIHDIQAGRDRNGRIMREIDDPLPLHDLVNQCLTEKLDDVERGELTRRSLHDYTATGKRLVQVFGRARDVTTIQPTDWSSYRKRFPKTWGPTTINNEIRRTKVLVNWGVENELLRPMRYGTGFKPVRKSVKKKAANKHREQHGAKSFTASEIHRLIDGATVAMRAQILLGSNCGFGNTDLSTLPKSAINGEWARYPRSKTGNSRAAWLWPETVEAVQLAIDKRPELREQDDPTLDGLVFLTRYRHPYTRVTDKGKVIDSLSLTFGKRLDACDLKQDGRNFYSLRRTFQTVADELEMGITTKFIMGHASDDMSATYRQSVSDDNVRTVCQHVRSWYLKGRAK